MGEDVGDFDAFFDEVFMRSFRLAFRILGDRMGAEDAAAEAFARAYADWERLKDAQYQVAWVLRVTSNLALDSLRRASRRVGLAEPQATSEEVIVTRLALAEALRALPRRQRESIALRYLAGLPEREVAELLGISTGSVKTHVSRGLTALRRRLRPSMEVNLG